MRKSKTLARFRAGEVAKVAILGHFIPSYVAHAAQAGYDCIWLDHEHRAMDFRETEALLAQFHLHDVDCLLRSPTREKSHLYRYLEDGASGLMIPHVNTPEEARHLVNAVKFPPIGDRGLDNAGLDSNFHENPDHDAYAAAANRETFLCVQIETPKAVENCEAIVEIEGVDAVFVGPGDLGFRYRKEGDKDGSMLELAFEKVAEVCARHGKAWGSPALSREELHRRIEQGGQLMANFGEFAHLRNGLIEAAKDFETG